MKCVLSRPLSRLVICLACVAALPAMAAPPWAKLIPFRKIEADPNKEYRLTDENGPWTIIATTFSGQSARQQAHELVIELRRDYQLPAYLHQKEFDYTGKVEGIGLDPRGNRKRMRHQRSVKYTEYAVLVGDYASVDDARIEKDLALIKTIRPAALDPNKQGEKVSQSFFQIRELYRRANLDKKDAGPMYRAFVVRNPLIPKEFFVHSGLSPLVLKMNKYVKYSLLKNPGKYTVQIATFKGEIYYETEMKPEESDNWWQGLVKRRKPSKLELAAEHAHKLTMALREQGVEAYEFHDRNVSIVTVGSFDEVGYRQPNGQLELLPEVYAVMKRYSADRTAPGRIKNKSTAVVGTGLIPKELDGIPFDLLSRPVRVPKRPLVQ